MYRRKSLFAHEVSSRLALACARAFRHHATRSLEKIQKERVPDKGLEPLTTRLRVLRSTD